MGKGDPEGGRPVFKVDWKMVAGLLKIQCTGEEIAAAIGCSYDTIERACKREQKISFADYSAQNRGSGRASLRRVQWKSAESGNPTMLIWLGKNWLDQTDKAEIKAEHSILPYTGWDIERAKPD